MLNLIENFLVKTFIWTLIKFILICIPSATNKIHKLTKYTKPNKQSNIVKSILLNKTIKKNNKKQKNLTLVDNLFLLDILPSTDRKWLNLMVPQFKTNIDFEEHNSWVTPLTSHK